MSESFLEWEKRHAFPTAQATADALGIVRRYIYLLRDGYPPSGTVRLLMRAIDILHEYGEPWPPEPEEGLPDTSVTLPRDG